MRRLTLTLFIIIASWSVAAAQSLLDTFEKNLAQLGLYRAQFTVEIDGYQTSGSYIVEGDNFYATMAGVEIYVAQGLKHEVNAEAREVVIDSAASLGNDILSNPANGFKLLKEQYNLTPTTVDGAPALKLSQKEGSQTILVVADKGGALPKRIVYSDGGAELTITFTSIAATNSPLPLFDASRYVDYEVVDMR